MSNFIKLSDMKERKLKEEEMRRINGGQLVVIPDSEPVMHYGIVH